VTWSDRGSGLEVRRTELAELAVCDEQLAKRAKTLESLVAVLLGSVSVERGIETACIALVEVLRLPDEILQKVAVVLGEKQGLGLLHDVAQVTNQGLALGRKALRRVPELVPLQRRVHCHIDLLVLEGCQRFLTWSPVAWTYGGHFAIGESGEDAIKLQLGVDVLLLDRRVDWHIHRHLGDEGRWWRWLWYGFVVVTLTMAAALKLHGITSSGMG